MGTIFHILFVILKYTFFTVLILGVICIVFITLSTEKGKRKKLLISAWLKIVNWIKIIINKTKGKTKKNFFGTERKESSHNTQKPTANSASLDNEEIEKKYQLLEQHIHGLNKRLMDLDEKFSLLTIMSGKMETISLQLSELMQKGKEEETKIEPQIHHKSIPFSRHTRYVSSPSMINPVRFLMEDMHEAISENIFSVDIFSEEEAEIDVVVNPDTEKKILSSLAYHQYVVEIVDMSKGKANGIEVLEKGKLHKQDGVWLLTKKIKIRIN